MKYINRTDRKISHIFHSESKAFLTPQCDPGLVILEIVSGVTVTDEPRYTLCKRCAKIKERDADAV